MSEFERDDEDLTYISDIMGQKDMITLLKPFKNCNLKTFNYLEHGLYLMKNEINPEILFPHHPQ